MKKQITTIIYSVFALIVLIGCSSGRRTVNLTSTRPAEISIPSELKTLLILDRTKFDKDAISIVEGILTGELPEEDKAAVQAMIRSFNTQLSYSPRFQTKIATERFNGNSLTNAFPDQLDWNMVRRLCSRYGADAMVSIEMFDTDFIVTEGKRTTTRKVETDSTTQEVPVDEFYANGVSNIAIGIRFYNPVDRSIEDQQLFKRTNTWEASAYSKAEAIAKLINKGDASRYLSERVGSNYAFRIAPMPIQITRSFTGKTKKLPELEQGTRYADVADWGKAMEIWKNALGKASAKEDGYLAYNIAIAYEVLGDLDTAREWAQKSYAQYGNRDGRSLVSTIETRIRNEQIARDQMSN